jgi:5-methylcytosine-specific restriction enzyme A
LAHNDITRDAVLEAIAEYGGLSQDGFLERYGFDRARQYLLVHDGRRYDSKAIVGAAHGFLPGERPLTAGEFSGGEATVGRLLRRLGFTVQVGDALTAHVLVRLLSKLQLYRRQAACALSADHSTLGVRPRPRRRAAGYLLDRPDGRSATCSIGAAVLGKEIASTTR